LTAHKKQGRFSRFIIIGLFFLLLLAMVFSLWLGRYPVPVRDIVRIITGTAFGEIRGYEDVQWIVVEIARLPRILTVTLAGFGLALCGAAMQGVFRNPLVGPEVVGVSSGATVGGVLAIILGLSSLSGIVIMAFIFGTSALAIAFLMSRISGKQDIIGLVLSGVIVSAFFSAMTGLATYLADPDTQLPGIIYWQMGSFADATYPKVAFLAGIVLFSGFLLLGLSWRLNLLALGSDDVRALGMNTDKLRWGVVALVSLIVAAQVAVSGGVGWVGLVIPHFARMAVGPEHSRLLPASSLAGGIYLLMMDNLSRTMTVQELPIGLLTSIIGTPVFAWLFLKMHNKGWQND
jgi:iron complex transport system permease protein